MEIWDLTFGGSRGRRSAALMLLCASVAIWTSAFAAEPGILQVRIYDNDRKTLTAARVNVIGPDHAFYEPDPSANSLAQFSLKRAGNRSNTGPIRYYGSFFYTEGNFEIQLPPGIARVEIWKGYSYYPVVLQARIASGQIAKAEAVLQRAVDMPRWGWQSSDVHLHPDRTTAESDHRVIQVMSAEDVELGYIGTPRTAKGYGIASLYSEGRYQIVSGREITTPNLGHINFFMVDSLIPMLRNGPAPPGTPLAAMYDQVLNARGAMQHNHGGYGMEIYADVVLGKSDWVELAQFGGYRPLIGEEGYYALLNSGYRYPIAGGSDWPTCRAFGDSRTYIADGSTPGFPTATGRLLDGQAFVTSGPLLFLTVDGKGPGSDIELSGESPRQVPVVARALSAEFPIESVEIVQDGKVVANWRGADEVYQKELKASLTVGASSWIAARSTGAGYSHAHTNPVWIYHNGLAPFRREALTKVLGRISKFGVAQLPSGVADVVSRAKTKVEQCLAEGTIPPRPALPSIGRFPVGPTDTTLLPAMTPRPKSTDRVTISGSVKDSAGSPIAGATVSARATGPTTRTNASGAFSLEGVDTRRPLFIRVSHDEYATTNTSYLNPWGPKENLRILALKEEEIRSLLAAWGAGDRGGPSRTILLFDSVGDGGAPLRGLQLTSSPRGQGGWPANVPQFGYADAQGGFTEKASTRYRNAGIQIVGLAQIAFQPSSPAIPNVFEANTTITVSPLGKDIVLPAFAGQVSYAVIRGNQ